MKTSKPWSIGEAMPQDAAPTVRMMRREDLSMVAEIHVAAFQGYMNTSLGRAYLRSFLGWFLEKPYTIALVGMIDGRPHGYVVGAPFGYQSRMNRELALTVAGALCLRPWLLLRRDILRALKSRLAALKKPPRKDSRDFEAENTLPGMSLVGIGVAPAARHFKVGSSLIRAFEAHAEGLGMRVLRLSVYRDNEAACKFYERNGWRQMESHGGSVVYYTKKLGPMAMPSDEGTA